MTSLRNKAFGTSLIILFLYVFVHIYGFFKYFSYLYHVTLNLNMTEKKTLYKIFLFTLLMGYCLFILLASGTSYSYIGLTVLILLIIFFGGLFYFLRKEIKMTKKEIGGRES